MEDRGQVRSFSERLYRTLLVAYPKEFRVQYREQLVQAFGDLCREELEQRGKKGLLVLWMRTLGDLVVSVFSARSGIPVFSFGGIRVGGLIIMLGGVLQFVAWTLFFSGIRLRSVSATEIRLDDLADLAFPFSSGATAFPLLATGLFVLGIFLARRVRRGPVWVRYMASAGTILAAVSAGMSVARIVAEILIKPPLPIVAGPPFSPGVDPSAKPFGQPIEVLTDSSLVSLMNVLGHSEYWTLAFASIVLGGVLLMSGVVGWWWVILPLLGLFAVPQVIGLLRVALLLVLIGIPGTSETLSGLLLAPHALVALGWVTAGLMLVSRRGERLEEPARAQ